jgi:hypothetical protein
MSAPMPGRPAAPSVSELPTTPESDLYEVLHRHEARQALAARAAYSLLRITAAAPPDSRFVADAATAGQRATAWLTASATNPGRWASRSVLAAELTELDALLAELRCQLSTVLTWVTANSGGQPTRQSTPQNIRVPRTLLAECTTLVSDLATLVPAAAA